MTRLFFSLTWALVLLLFPASLLAVLSRIWETWPPQLLYSADIQLYETRLGCSSLLHHCVLNGNARLSGMGAVAGLPSPGGDYVAIYGLDGWLIMPVDCFYERKACSPAALNPPANGVLIAWGPDGTTLAYIEVTTAGSVMHMLTRRCWDDSAPGRCLRQEARLSGYALNLAGWSADGERLAFSNIQTRDLLLLDSACLAQPDTCESMLEVLLPAGRAPSPPQWAHLAPDGTRIVFSADVSGRGIAEQLFLFDLNAQTIERFTFRQGQSTQPQWSPEGRYLAYSGFSTRASSDLSLFVADMQRGLHVRLITRRGQDITGIRWWPS